MLLRESADSQVAMRSPSPARPGERLGPGAVRDREVGHLGEPARDDRCLGVLAVADAVDDPDRDGDEVLEHAAEFGADHIRVHERAEVRVRRDQSRPRSRFRGSRDEITAAVGCSCAISSARFGPDATATRSGRKLELLVEHLAHPKSRALLDALHQRHDDGVVWQAARRSAPRFSRSDWLGTEM